MVVFHDPACTSYSRPGHPERPQRVAAVVDHLRAGMADLVWAGVPAVAEEVLLEGHDAEMVARLEVEADLDADTPWYPGIGGHARRSVAAGLAAARAAVGGRRALSLMRPPGHHATRRRAMGFCYLSTVALAALALRRDGVERVAVWDFDAHHGNGTEDILRGREGFLFSSVHQFPGYPGTGLSSTAGVRNYPVPPGVGRADHLEVLESSWEAVVGFRPQVILVSAGFDAYREDPLTELNLEAEDFAMLGSWCAAAPCPVAAVLEGGYSDELPRLVAAFVRAWEPA